VERPPFMHTSAGLVGEFYQLILAATYHGDGLWGEATFDLYARGMPPEWGYLVAAGLEPVLDMLERFAFEESEVASLQAMPAFARVPSGFFDALRRLRFEGEVLAVPEGTPMFPNEPLLRITAPLWVATLFETRLIQLVGTATAVATRAARVVDAAQGRPVYDFGSRRSAGGESALLAARSAWIGGVAGTTNANATVVLGVPAFGTMSDTFLASYTEDRAAYDAFRVRFPSLGHYALPDDDPLDGVLRFQRFHDEVRIVRIDHADLNALSRSVRASLDHGGMRETRILGSGHLDEGSVAKLVAAGAPVDMFAVGRSLGAHSEPAMRLAFRLAELQRGTGSTPITRPGSSTYPGRKQVIRFADHDLLCLESEAGAFARAGWPLLRPVMRGGRRAPIGEDLAMARDRRAAMVAALPVGLRGVQASAAREVRISDRLAHLTLAG
jgi:nicotinate phosphoribosyltransferase